MITSSEHDNLTIAIEKATVLNTFYVSLPWSQKSDDLHPRQT